VDKVNEALKEFGALDRVKKMEAGFGGGKCPKHIIDFYTRGKNYFAFLLGTIYNQQMPAEHVWAIPYNLFRMLGHLDPLEISGMSVHYVLSLFDKLPRKPRYPPQMAQQTIEAAKKIINEYGGIVENLWTDNPTCSQMQRRFEEFKGIGQKKAAMATETLVKKFNIPLRDRSGLDIAVDSLVIRVFRRCGFVDREDKNLVISKARELNPEYPAILDRPCWEIGRSYCFPANPDCNNCPIGNICPKHI
jgi:endonuclease III